MKRSTIEYCMLLLLGVVVLPLAAFLAYSAVMSLRSVANVVGLSALTIPQLIQCLLQATQFLAIVVAGTWTYYRFVKGRTFHSRLNLQLKIEPILDWDRHFLKVSVRAANVGPSRITFSSDYSALCIFPGVTYTNRSAEIKWEGPLKITLPLFTEHTFVESGEEIYEERLVCMRDSAKSYKAVAIFRSEDQKRTITAVIRVTPITCTPKI